MNEKIFLLGIGCQKGGTTWLHKHLSASSHVNFGFAKEYHVFDVLYLPSCSVFLTDKLSRARKLANNEAFPPKSADRNLLTHINFYVNVDNYFDYFDYLYCKSDASVVVGDITPSYSGLPVRAFERIRARAEAKGFRVKVIFFMRDPYDRVWSNLRMNRRNRLVKTPNHTFQLNEEDHLLRFYKSEQAQFRTRYERTIANIEKVFDPEDVHYDFFESLFTQSAVKRVEKFLGIPHRRADFDSAVNVSEKKQTISEHTTSEIVNFYENTYRSCFDKFGEKKIRKIWSGCSYLG